LQTTLANVKKLLKQNRRRKTMRVTQLARLLGVTSDTVRFYTRIKVLQPRKSNDNGYREYSMKDISRLRFVLSARQLGFTVDDIQQILTEADKGQSPCPTVRQLIEHRLQETEQRYLDTMKLRERMQLALEDWNEKPNKAPTGDMVCHLIEGFMATAQEE
jgi:DNA-binding transcriptional MerR regulator